MDSSITPILLTAVATAIFTYIAERIRWRFEVRYDRFIRHHNALVFLEYVLNENLGILSDNKYLIDGFTQAYAKSTADQVRLQWNLPRHLRIEKSFYTDLLELDILNKLFMLNDDFRKVNDDIDSCNDSYGIIRHARISASIDGLTYLVNTQGMVEAYALERRMLEEIQSSIQLLLARVRIQTRKDRVSRGWLVRGSMNPSKVTTGEVESEVNKMKAEIAEIQAEHRKKIERISTGESATPPASSEATT